MTETASKLWIEYLGQNVDSVSIQFFLEKCKKIIKESNSYILYILDYNKTGQISLDSFIIALKLFGPDHKLYQNINEVLSSPYFYGWITPEQSRQLLQFSGLGDGSFVVRISDDFNFIVDYSKDGNIISDIIEVNGNGINHVTGHYDNITQYIQVNRSIYAFPVDIPFAKIESFFWNIDRNEAESILSKSGDFKYIIRFDPNERTIFKISFKSDTDIFHSIVNIVPEGYKTQSMTFEKMNDVVQFCIRKNFLPLLVPTRSITPYNFGSLRNDSVTKLESAYVSYTNSEQIGTNIESLDYFPTLDEMEESLDSFPTENTSNISNDNKICDNSDNGNVANRGFAALKDLKNTNLDNSTNNTTNENSNTSNPLQGFGFKGLDLKKEGINLGVASFIEGTARDILNKGVPPKVGVKKGPPPKLGGPPKSVPSKKKLPPPKSEKLETNGNPLKLAKKPTFLRPKSEVIDSFPVIEGEDSTKPILTPTSPRTPRDEQNTNVVHPFKSEITQQSNTTSNVNTSNESKNTNFIRSINDNETDVTTTQNDEMTTRKKIISQQPKKSMFQKIDPKSKAIDWMRENFLNTLKTLTDEDLKELVELDTNNEKIKTVLGILDLYVRTTRR